jgi:hypothetical protein
MSVLVRYQLLFNEYLITPQINQRMVTIFCKSLYVFLLLKIFFMGEVAVDLLSVMAGNVSIAYCFLVVLCGVLVVSLFLKINYISAFLIFVLSFLFSRATHVIANGSDLILNLFLFLSIFLSSTPRSKNSLVQEKFSILRNFFLLMCRVQLALIYLLSGFDKIMSEAWRSGEAVFSIVNLDYFFHPFISHEFSETSCLLLAWAAIVFELSFALLIWVKKLRIPLLILGVLFHLGIAIFLSLPDFGILMILLYTLLLPEKIFGRTKPIVSGGN